jgi:hypothetical protein
MGEKRNAHRSLARNILGSSHLEDQERRREDNTEVGLRKGQIWIELAQDHVK